ncbi:O-antigen ligase family protein [Pseudomonas putida]|uniref:O-antigen ligase family protein n=1 Tax=Pseudomonas putida TaxID=303 RepID=UPI002D1E98B9|nr:O-antigen ligase family protein [Pseudomonas putida]MEB3901403.1 O-antigen ligase family protein [Pseudomonas putida]
MLKHNAAIKVNDKKSEKQFLCEVYMREQSIKPAGFKIKVNTIIILLISLAPFNFSVVDKTGLDANLDNVVDKIVRVIWFFMAVVGVMLLKPHAFLESVRAKNNILKILVVYFVLLIIGLVANNVGLIGYYRLLEYTLVLFALAILDQIIRRDGYEVGVRTFAEWVGLASHATLGLICVGLIIAPDHFFALETQGRYRLGGNAYSPNFLGMVFALGILSNLFLLGGEEVLSRKSKLVLGSLFLLIALYFTGSRTAQFSLVLALLWWWYIKRSQINKALIWLATMSVVLPTVIIFIQVFIEQVLPFFGKGERPIYDLLTLNNRSVVAEVGLKGALENWVTGVGFVEGVKNYYKENFTQSYWLPPHSHNALIEVFLSGGLPTLILMLFPFLGVLGLIVGSALKKTSRSDGYLAATSIPLLLACATMTVFGGVYTVLTLWFFFLAMFSWAKR